MKTEAMRNPTDGIIYGVRAYLNSLDSLATMAGDYELKYAHRLKGIDVEGMFNMYTMESFIAPPGFIHVEEVKMRMMDNNLTLVFLPVGIP